MKQIYAQWPEPPEVTAHRRQEQKQFALWMHRVFGKWSLLLGLPVGVAVFFLEPSMIRAVFPIICCHAVLISCTLWLPTWTQPRDRDAVCVIDEQGLCVKIGKHFYAGHCLWARVTEYEFADHPNIEGIRCLKIKERHKKIRALLCFSPQQVDEQELREIIEDRLGQRP